MSLKALLYNRAFYCKAQVDVLDFSKFNFNLS